MADLWCGGAAAAALAFIAPAIEVQVLATERPVSTARGRNAPGPGSTAALSAARCLATAFAGRGVALGARRADAARGRRRARRSGLPGALIVASLHLIVEALGVPSGAAAASLRRLETYGGVATAGLDTFPAGTIRQAPLDCGVATARFSRSAGHASAVQTGGQRHRARPLIDPFTGIAARLRPCIGAARGAGAARLAVPRHAVGVRRAGLAFAPRPLQVARLRVSVSRGIAAPRIRHTFARAFACVAEGPAQGVVNVRSTHAPLTPGAVALESILGARRDAGALLADVAAQLERGPVACNARLDGAVFADRRLRGARDAFAVDTSRRAARVSRHPLPRLRAVLGHQPAAPHVARRAFCNRGARSRKVTGSPAPGLRTTSTARVTPTSPAVPVAPCQGRTALAARARSTALTERIAI